MRQAWSARPLRARARRRDRSERKLVSGGIEDLQREVLAQREDVSRLAKAMHALQALEHLVATLGRAGSAPRSIGRLQALEKLLLARAPGRADLRADRGAARGAGRPSRTTPPRERAAGAGAAQKIAGLASDLATLPQAAPDLAAVTAASTSSRRRCCRPRARASQLSDRLRAVEEAVAAQRAQTFESTAALVADIKAVSGAIANQQAHSERAQAGVNERVQSGDLPRTPARRIRHQARRAAAGARRRARRPPARGRRRAGPQRRDDRRPARRHRRRGCGTRARLRQGLTEMHEALVRLNGHQQALAGTLEASRQDGAGVREAMVAVAGRIEALEREAGRSLFVLEALAGRLEGMHRVTVERHHRRNRLWYWLFGTDDWAYRAGPRRRPHRTDNAAIGAAPR